MSKKVDNNIINLPTNKVTDEEFAMFMDALLGPYKGGRFMQE